MKRLLLVPALGVVGLALASPAQRAARRHDRTESPRVHGRGPAAVQRVAARRVRQRLSRRHQGRRARRAQPRRLQLSGRADVAARRQGLSPELRRLGPLSAVVPHRLRGRLLGRLSPATRPTTAIARQRHGGGYPTHAAARLSQPRRLSPGEVSTGQGGYGYATVTAATATARRTRNGTNDGYEKGREDARIATRTTRCATSGTAKATTTTRAQYGPRQQYENVYRQGFKEGYDRGYREWSYRR